MANEPISEVMDNTIIDGYDYLYKAYARVSWRASRDPDWEPVRDRLYEVMRVLERAANLLAGAGYSPGLGRETLRRLEAAARDGDAPRAVELVSCLEEQARRVMMLNAVVPRHVCAYRLVVLLLVAITVFAAPYVGVLGAVMGVASIGFALASVLVCFTPLATPSQVASLVLLYALVLYAALAGGRTPGLEALLGAAASWLGAVAGHLELKRGARLYIEAFSLLGGNVDISTYTNA